MNIWTFQKIVVPLHPLRRNDRGVEQLVARQAHNLEVACSSPASATKKKRNPMDCVSFFVLRIISLHVTHHLLIITLSGSL